MAMAMSGSAVVMRAIVASVRVAVPPRTAGAALQDRAGAIGRAGSTGRD
jgi:hypothetical protein